MNRRWSEHCGRGGATWTKKHRPISIESEREVPEATAKLEENKLTARLMLKYGINRVRGGSLCWSRSYTTVPREVSMVTNFLCRALELDNVRTRQMVFKELDNDSTTANSGSPVSVMNSSDAMNALHGLFSNFNIQGSNTSSIVRKIWDSGCERCGRDSHTIESCYARTDRNGASLA